MAKRKFLDEAPKFSYEKINEVKKTESSRTKKNNNIDPQGEFIINFKSTIETRKKLRMLKYRDKKSIQSLINEALDDYFKKMEV